jgi:hypothetical protein
MKLSFPSIQLCNVEIIHLNLPEVRFSIILFQEVL